MRIDVKKAPPTFARQAICNQHQDTVAYELLSRPQPPEDSILWQQERGYAATEQVLQYAFDEIGIEHVTYDLPAFINCTQEWLRRPPAYPLKKIVLEVLEFIEPSKDNLIALKALSDKGFMIALDDFVGSDLQRPFLQLAHIIKVDIRFFESLEEVKQLKLQTEYHHPGRHFQWLAEKVETEKEFNFCKSIGFSYFQGFYLDEPENFSVMIKNEKTKIFIDEKIKDLNQATDLDLLRMAKFIV